MRRGGGAGRGERWKSQARFWKRSVLGLGGGGEVTGVMNEAKNIRCVGAAEEGAGERATGTI